MAFFIPSGDLSASNCHKHDEMVLFEGQILNLPVLERNPNRLKLLFEPLLSMDGLSNTYPRANKRNNLYKKLSQALYEDSIFYYDHENHVIPETYDPGKIELFNSIIQTPVIIGMNTFRNAQRLLPQQQLQVSMSAIIKAGLRDDELQHSMQFSVVKDELDGSFKRAWFNLNQMEENASIAYLTNFTGIPEAFFDPRQTQVFHGKFTLTIRAQL